MEPNSFNLLNYATTLTDNDEDSVVQSPFEKQNKSEDSHQTSQHEQFNPLNEFFPTDRCNPTLEKRSPAQQHFPIVRTFTEEEFS